MKNIGSKVISGAIKLIMLGGVGYAYTQVGPEVTDLAMSYIGFADNAKHLTFLGSIVQPTAQWTANLLTQGAMLTLGIFGVKYGSKFVDASLGNGGSGSAPSLSQE